MSEPTKVLPEKFVHWIYQGRAELVRRQAEGEDVPAHEIFLGFTRHNPAVVSHGPAGLNASIKGVGFVPRSELLQETLAGYMAHIEKGWRDGYSHEGLQVLMHYLYGDGCLDRIDLTRLGSLEMARDHTWRNYQADPTSTLLFFQPPAISYEIRGRVEIHEQGSPYHTLVNAQHDLYHQPHLERWAERPAYIFTIEEVYDNSATPKGFGTRIY